MCNPGVVDPICCLEYGDRRLESNVFKRPQSPPDHVMQQLHNMLQNTRPHKTCTMHHALLVSQGAQTCTIVATSEKQVQAFSHRFIELANVV